MINTLYAGSGLSISGGTGGLYVNRSYNSNAQMVGDMMYDYSTQCIKVYDGSSWQSLVGSSATINLDEDTKSLLEWARKKRTEELELEQLAQTNATIRDLTNQIKEKQEQINIVQTLIKKEQTLS